MSIIDNISSLSGYYTSASENSRYHLRLLDDVDQVKNILYRLEQSVHTIKNIIQPMYPSYPICSIKDGEKVIKLVKKRIDTYSTKDYVNNISRMAFPMYVLDDIARDLRVISVGLQTLMMDLQMFHIFLTNRPYMDEKQQKTTLKQIDKQCRERKKDPNDIKFKDILNKLKKEFSPKTILKRTLHVPSRMKRAYSKGMKQTRKREIVRTLQENAPDVVNVQDGKPLTFLPYVEPEQIYPNTLSRTRTKTRTKPRSRTKSKSKTKSRTRSNSNSNSSSRSRSRSRTPSKTDQKSKERKSKPHKSKGRTKHDRRRSKHKAKNM